MYSIIARSNRAVAPHIYHSAIVTLRVLILVQSCLALAEKTLSLLREGSKHVYRSESEGVSCCSRAPSKQPTLQEMMQGGCTGYKGKGKERQKANACSSCHLLCDGSGCLCSHCSKAVCPTCARLCQQCKEMFCPLCSVVK